MCMVNKKADDRLMILSREREQFTSECLETAGNNVTVPERILVTQNFPGYGKSSILVLRRGSIAGRGAKIVMYGVLSSGRN